MRKSDTLLEMLYEIATYLQKLVDNVREYWYCKTELQSNDCHRRLKMLAQNVCDGFVIITWCIWWKKKNQLLREYIIAYD